MFEMPTAGKALSKNRNDLRGESLSKERVNRRFLNKLGGKTLPFEFGCSDSMSEVPRRANNLEGLLNKGVSKSKGIKMKRIEKLISKTSEKNGGMMDMCAEDEHSVSLSEFFSNANLDVNGDSLTATRSNVRRKLFDDDLEKLIGKTKRTPGKRSVNRMKKLLTGK